METLISASIPNPGAVTYLMLAVDDQAYAQAIADCFQQASKAVSVRWTSSAQECLAALRVRKEGGVPPPDLLILGLEKPESSSMEILKFICKDEVLRQLPVIILSSNDDEDTVRSFYAHRCSTYVQSCEDRVEMLRKVRTVCDYWLTVATLPSRVRGNWSPSA